MKTIVTEIIILMVELNSKSDTIEELISKLGDKMKKLSKMQRIEILKEKLKDIRG